jgi:AcrR family transcriptional regulator
MMSVAGFGKPRGIRRRPSRDERRRQIVNAALREFTRVGYRGTTSRRLAQLVGITEVSLFRYFQSKEHLYAAVIEKYSGVTKPQEISSKACQMKFEKGLEYLTTEILKMIRRQVPLIKLMLMESGKPCRQARRAFHDEPHKYLVALEHFLRIQRRRNAVRQVNIALTARAFLSVLFASVLFEQIFHVRDQRRRSSKLDVNAFVDVFINGVACKARRKPGNRRRRR